VCNGFETPQRQWGLAGGNMSILADLDLSRVFGSSVSRPHLGFLNAMVMAYSAAARKMSIISRMSWSDSRPSVFARCGGLWVDCG
jgi:hypothetical protein